MTYTREQIKQLFQSSFNLEKWTDCIINFFKAKEVNRKPVDLEIDKSEGVGYELGYLDTDDNYRIGFFYLKMNSSVDRRKVGLRQLINKYIKIDSDAGIGVFDDGKHWRLSFITDLRDEKTAPKRFTFVFGDSDNQYRTAVDRFAELQQKGVNFRNIKDAFSVEALTKQFYNDLFEWYNWALKDDTGVYFPNNPNTPADDREQLDTKLIRLITRLMFVWFIKQKGLVPDALFNPDEVSHWLKDFDPDDMQSSNYYQAILQNLFFATLNRPIKTITYDKDGKEYVERRGFAHLQGQPDVKSLYRYQELFKISEDKILSIFEFIPFINGGLFECLDKNKKQDGVPAYYHDGFSRNSTIVGGHFTKRAFVPNKLFFDENNGLLSILKRYNFTVEENTPSEQQVALDPELLGKVFENLLGVYNPETQETARNQSGSFYTPREIVNYMVDVSLQTYLGNTDEVKAIFADNFVYDDNRKSFYDSIINKLKNIKVFDPACGSGAFPIGMLNRIIEIFERLHADGEKYDLKLQVMENCIYGCDIQTIAAQITKLRFFISLVCDCHKTDNPDENYGIPNLPNLETHFVAANSLIELKKTNELCLFDYDINDLKDKLKKVRHEHFTAKTVYQKTKLRDRDNQLREELAEMLKSDNIIAIDDALQMAAWNPYDQNAKSPFFDPEWMYGITDGFDVVIGNPPYISTKGVKEIDKQRYEAQFGFSDDTYNLFTLRALGSTFLKDKNNSFRVNGLVSQNGTLIYIIPKTFWTTQTKRFMRDVILGKQVNVIYDTANPFEAVMVDTCIIQITNKPYDNKNKIVFLDGCKDLKNPVAFAPIEQSVYINTQNSVIFKPTEQNMRIWRLYGEKVKDLYNKWWDKIKTSRDIEKNAAELKKYRDSLKPGDIALLGCLTEGGQGLATANNGKYIAVRKSTKWAKNILDSRPKKLEEAIRKKPAILKEIGNVTPQEYLSGMSEQEIADCFDRLKDRYGRDIFGQGYIYKLIDDSEIANVDLLSDDEKENGIDTSKKYYVPYDKGDKDGNRWYLETPFAIAWSKENVHFLKTDPKARYQGYTFFFKEGFCWTDINSTFLKARLKAKGIFDVVSMSLFTRTKLPDWYYVCLINTDLMSFYVDNFINNTSHFQINDARQTPIVIPTEAQLNKFNLIFTKAQDTKKQQFANLISIEKSENELASIQKELDTLVAELYKV